MKAHYVQAFVEALEAGMSADTAVVGLKTVLARKKHEKLLTPILLETLKILESQKGALKAVVKTASIKDAKSLASEIKSALTELGVTKNTRVENLIDETLVGGFVATFNYQEHDQSYKRALTNLYKSITN